MSASRRLVLSLVAALAVLGVVLLLDRDRGGVLALPADEAAPAASVPGAAGVALPRSEIEGRAPRTPATPPDVAASEPARSPPAATSWILWLRAEGPAHPQPVTVRVRACPDGEPFATGEAVVAACALNARTRIEIGELLSAGRSLAALVIEGEHPELRANVLSLALPPWTGDEDAPPAPVEATLALESRIRVVGEVVDPAGEAAACRVGVWRLDGDLAVDGRVGEAGPEAAGLFEIELPGPGEYLLVAARGDHRPAWRRFQLLPALPLHDAGELVLERGMEFEGRFTVGGAAPALAVSFTLRRSVEGAELGWDWNPGATSPGTMVWSGAHVERKSADEIADREGRFFVRGLEPGDYTLHLHGFDTGHGRMSREPRPVTAPAHGVNIELAWSRVAVALELEDPTTPPRAATLVLERPDRAPERTDMFGGELDGSGEREFVFDAGEPLAFQVEIEGLEPLRRELLAPPAGSREEVRLRVPALDRSAALRLELRGERPPDGTPFVVHLAALRAGSVPKDLGLVGGGDTREATLRDGALSVDALAPGPTVVLVYPGKWVGQRGTHWLDASLEVELQAEREATATVQLERGGRLRVGKRDGRGGWSHAPCEIRDGTGSPIETTFVCYAPDGAGGMSSRGMLPDLAPSEVVPNLPPGRYTVHVGAQERTVEVRAGETTEVLFE